MAKAINSSSYISKPKKRGLAAKTQTSKTKTSKLYKKQYIGQGR